MRKFLFAPLLTVVMIAAVILGANFFLKPAEADIQPVAQMATQCDTSLIGLVCARQKGSQIVISVAGSDVASLPLADVVKVPTVTVAVPSTIRVTLPRVTVTRPPVTVTLPRVTAQGPTITLPRQTVTVKLPGTTTTARLPGQTTTVPGQTVTTETKPSVVPVTVTAPNGQKIQTSVTITPSPQPGSVTTKPVVKTREVRVSVPAAIGIGVGVLILGLILGLLAIYAAYAVGYKDSEDAEKTAWHKFRNELFGRRDKGEN